MADRIAVMADGRVQQVATPVDLYRRPANRFVADFIGTSTMLPGHLDGDRFLSEELGALPRPAGGAPAGRCHLVVRPEDVQVVGARSGGLVQGRVAAVQFTGGTSHVAVAVPSLPRPFLVSVAGATELSRGQAVSLTWSTAVCVPDELR